MCAHTRRLFHGCSKTAQHSKHDLPHDIIAAARHLPLYRTACLGFGKELLKHNSPNVPQLAQQEVVKRIPGNIGDLKKKKKASVCVWLWWWVFY